MLELVRRRSDIDANRRRVVESSAVVAKKDGEEESNSDMITKCRWHRSRSMIAKQESEISSDDDPLLIRIGDTVDLNQLLFTAQRDYLVTADGREVKVDRLRNSYVIIFMVSLCCPYTCNYFNLETVDVYSQLVYTGANVEVVLVTVGDYYSIHPALSILASKRPGISFQRISLCGALAGRSFLRLRSQINSGEKVPWARSLLSNRGRP